MIAIQPDRKWCGCPVDCACSCGLYYTDEEPLGGDGSEEEQQPPVGHFNLPRGRDRHALKLESGDRLAGPAQSERVGAPRAMG